MKGATAVPSVNTISVPNKRRNMTIGANHHFFRTFKNSQNSYNNVILDMLFPEF